MNQTLKGYINFSKLYSAKGEFRLLKKIELNKSIQIRMLKGDSK